jgi:hypothetical protein
MKRANLQTHITDDQGNDVVAPSLLDNEYEALNAVAKAADEEHRAHCLLLTSNCPICRALAALDSVRGQKSKVGHN